MRSPSHIKLERNSWTMISSCSLQWGANSILEQENLWFSIDLLSFSLPNDSKWLPTLSNGHLGFTVLSDEVYMNGLYNGKNGLSHRAKIPNFANILLADCLKQICKYTLNMKRGIFIMELYVENQFIATHLLFAHRFLNRALINQIHIQRLGSRGESLPSSSLLPSLPRY